MVKACFILYPFNVFLSASGLFSFSMVVVKRKAVDSNSYIIKYIMRTNTLTREVEYRGQKSKWSGELLTNTKENVRFVPFAFMKNKIFQLGEILICFALITSSFSPG